MGTDPDERLQYLQGGWGVTVCANRALSQCLQPSGGLKANTVRPHTIVAQGLIVLVPSELMHE